MDNYMLILPIASHIVAAFYLQKQKYNKFITACFWLLFAALAYCVPLVFSEQLPIFLTLLFLQLAFFCATAVGTTGEKVFLILAYANSFSICFGFSLILSASIPPGVVLLVCQIILTVAANLATTGLFVVLLTRLFNSEKVMFKK